MATTKNKESHSVQGQKPNFKKVRTLEVAFDQPIYANEIKAFRGAIAKIVAKLKEVDTTLYHNHTEQGFRFSYPLIQYKRLNGFPVIFGIEQGIDALEYFFNKDEFKLHLYDRVADFKIDFVHLNKYPVQVFDHFFSYRLFNWVALNTKNFEVFNQLDDEDQKKRFLEKILVGNLLSFAKGMNIWLDKKIEVRDLTVKRVHNTKFKNVALLAFNIDFSCNLLIPQHLGIGKGVSLGYGTVIRIYPKRQDKDYELE